MRRLNVPELHDFSWCPPILRDGLTDFLEISIETLDAYGPIRNHLAGAMAAAGCRQVVDLCSGAGGPWPGWLNGGLIDASVVLTDKFPNQRFRRRLRCTQIRELSFVDAPVDATAVPRELKGFRTIFSAFHHFPPNIARGILEDAVRCAQPIGIFELTSRTPGALLCSLLSAIGVWWLTPQIRPIDWCKWLWTYAIPIIPLVASFDGIASCLRSYSPQELERLAATIGGAYIWKTGIAKDVTYLIGLPA